MALSILTEWYRDYYSSWDSREILEQMVRDTVNGVKGLYQFTVKN